MRTKTSIAIDGVYLHDLDSRIIVQSIDEGEAKMSPRTVMLGGRVGQRLTTMDRQMLDVVVRFAVSGRRDMIGRAKIIEDIAAWASGSSILTVDYRPNRRLHVVCVQYPSIGNIKEWNEDMAITFRAYEQPYWEDETPTMVGASFTAEKNVKMFTPGSMPTPLNAIIRNPAESEITSVELLCDGQKLAFDGIHLGQGSEMRIDHNGSIMQATIDGATVYGCRTTDSDDDLMLLPGMRTITVRVNGTADVKLHVRGRYL